jgi:hypothetical protein
VSLKISQNQGPVRGANEPKGKSTLLTVKTGED